MKDQYQTPPAVCKYMVSLLPGGIITVLEPTPGVGNLSSAALSAGYDVVAPEDYFTMERRPFDAVLMNPPFSDKSLILDNAPPDFINEKGMRVGYRFLMECMEMSDVIIALLPWFTIIDSDVRMR